MPLYEIYNPAQPLNQPAQIEVMRFDEGDKVTRATPAYRWAVGKSLSEFSYEMSRSGKLLRELHGNCKARNSLGADKLTKSKNQPDDRQLRFKFGKAIGYVR